MGALIKGKPVADAITEAAKKEASALKENGIYPKLMIVRAGEKESDLAYERGALARMGKCGILSEVKAFPEDVSLKVFIEALEDANGDETVHGILIFRPLPKQLDEEFIKHAISPQKDVDCFSPVNAAKVMEGDESGFPPCTAAAVMEILKYYHVDLEGKHAAVIGRSMVVGKPAAMLLLKENATVTLCHSKTKDLPRICSNAEILVAAAGKTHMVEASHIKEGAVVIDVGINVDGKGVLRGDVDTGACLEKAGMITPVPAGVGSVTTSVLAKHVVKAARNQSRS